MIKGRTILVDVDGTLLAGRSSESRFMLWLLRRREIGIGQLLAMLWFFIRYGARFGRLTGARNKGYLSGMPVARLTQLGEQFVSSELAPRLFNPMTDRIQQHLAGGDRVILLTGTPVFIATPLARHLHVPEFISMQPYQIAGRYKNRPPVVHPLASDKLSLLRIHGIDPADCVAYADSGHDIELMSAVAEAVAVMPDKALADFAKSQGWEIIEDGSTADSKAATHDTGKLANH